MARFRRYTPRHSPVADINITNLVDVTMVLLIIFIMVAPFTREGLEIELPKVKFAQRFGKQAIVLEMDQYGALALNGNPVDLESLPQKLREEKEAHKDWPVYFRADGRNTLQSAAEVKSAMMEAGIERYGELVEKKQ